MKALHEKLTVGLVVVVLGIVFFSIARSYFAGPVLEVQELYPSKACVGVFLHKDGQIYPKMCGFQNGKDYVVTWVGKEPAK